MIQKLSLSLFFLFGFFFIRITGPYITNKLKEFHKKAGTGLDKKEIIFKIFNLFFKFGSWMCIIYIILIWIDVVQFPNK